MNAENKGWKSFPGIFKYVAAFDRVKNRGQAAVEFTLVFLLLVIIAWIPADFGLALYTGQIAQNAVREGARIAAADPTLVPGTTTCTMPACYSAGNILKETGVRLPAALLGASTVSVIYPDGGAGCGQLLTVRVVGTYPFFFYKVLRFVGINVTVPTITRSSKMRWEHQC
jgi:Flp pilus assembly protein TadG